MNRTIGMSTVRGSLDAPPSKSIAQRAIALASMACGKSVITNAGQSADTMAVIDICKALGADISGDHTSLQVRGGIKTPQKTLNCGESGLAIRMFAPIASTFDTEVELTGCGSLTKRPMQMVVDALKQLGVQCNSNKGFLPLTVKGRLKGGNIVIECSESSQVLTGVLMAAPRALQDITIRAQNLKSSPYIALTVSLMRTFGVNTIISADNTYHIQAHQVYRPARFNVEGDWSGAAFMLVAAAIAGEIVIKNLNRLSLQADRAIIDVLKIVGADMEIDDNKVKVKKNRLDPFSFDATHSPDLFPPLVALAAHCNGKSVIKGIDRLQSKESNRALTLKSEFNKMGVEVELIDNSMHITGSCIKPATVKSHNDHRIAMACAVAALNCNGWVEIAEAEAVAKSYPDFFDDLHRITT